jgi:hypothetical protein
MKMEKLKMLSTQLFFASLFLIPSAFAEDCALCPRIKKVEQQIKVTTANPLATDEKSMAAQDALINEADLIIEQGLKEENFNEALALPLVRLMAHITEYDNGLQIVQNNYPAFSRQYNKSKSLLKATIEKVTREEKAAIRENYGIKGANLEKKSNNVASELSYLRFIKISESGLNPRLALC